MTTKETVNGSAKSGGTAAAGKDAEGSLFGGAANQAEVTEQLAKFLKQGPAQTNGQSNGARGETRRGKTLEHTIEEEPERTEDEEAQQQLRPTGEEGTQSDEGHEPSAEGEPAEGEEGAEAAEAAADLDDPNNPEGKGEEAVPKDWPKSAVSAIAGIRKERRELREEKETLTSSLNEALTRLEAEELKRPVVVPGDPLSFAQSPEVLEQWAQRAEGNLELIEGFLDESLSKAQQRRLEAFAQENGAWDETNDAPDKGKLKELKKMVSGALRTALPQKRELFAKHKEWEQHVATDPVLGPVWKNKGSQEYTDAMAVLETLPEMRRLGSYRAAAAIYALGLKEYRRLNPKAGAGGKAAAAAKNGDGKDQQQLRATGNKPKPATGTVKGPGRTTVLPRNLPAAEADEQAMRARVQRADATNEDFVEMTRRQLLGKIRA